MTEEKLEKIIQDNRFSSLCVIGEDKIKNLIEEVYYDGMLMGYQIAIDRLQRTEHRMPIDCTENYIRKNGKKIRRILDAINQASSDGSEKPD